MKKTTKNQPEHVQIGGMAYIENQYFMFAPDAPVPGLTQRFRGRGIGQQMSDGTFEFVASPRRRAKSELIRKLAHGRLSHTADGATLLTLKIFDKENLPVNDVIFREALEACIAIKSQVFEP